MDHSVEKRPGHKEPKVSRGMTPGASLSGGHGWKGSWLSPWPGITHLLGFPADESGDEESVSQTDKTELQNTLRTLSSKVEDLSTCNDLIAKHGTALQRSLSELESLKLPAESSEKIKQVNERATLFRITSNAMINVSTCTVSLLSFSPSLPLFLPPSFPLSSLPSILSVVHGKAENFSSCLLLGDLDCIVSLAK